jgi:MFS family permease
MRQHDASAGDLASANGSGSQDGPLRRWLDDLGVLRIGSVRRLAGADFASLTGDTMVFTAMVFAVLSVGATEFQVGLALAAQGAGVAVALLFGGVLGDRHPRRSVMVAADLLRFASQGTIAVLLLLGDASYWQLIASQLVHGVGTGFYMPASGAIVPDAVGAGLEQPTNAVKQVGRSVAGLGGPALGAFAVYLSGPGLAISADAATFLVSAYLLFGLSLAKPDKREGVENEKAASMLADLREGWSEFLGLSWMRIVTVQFTLVNALVLAQFFVFGPTLAADAHGGGVGTWATILFALALGELIGGFAVVSWRPECPLVVGTIAFLLWSAPLALLASHAPLAWILGGGVCAGAGAAVFTVLWETAVQLNTASEQRSRLMAFEQFGSLVGVPFGFLLAGLIGERIGPEQGLLGSLIFLNLAGLFVLTRRSVWELRGQPRGASRFDGVAAAGETDPLLAEAMVTAERLEGDWWVKVPAAELGDGV